MAENSENRKEMEEKKNGVNNEISDELKNNEPNKEILEETKKNKESEETLEENSGWNDLNPKVEPTQSGQFLFKFKSKKYGMDQGLFVVIRCIQKLRKKTNKPIFVGIAGPSGSGKTTLTSRIQNIIPNAVAIQLDMYLDTSKKVIDNNFDDFRLVDFELLTKNINELKAGKSTRTPLYDFRKSGRYAYKVIHPPADPQLVIVEGIYALHETVFDLFDLKIAVSGGVHLDLVKRVMRDRQRTGQAPNDSIKQISETVYPMFKAFIEPALKKADIRIVNHFNPFTGLQNPFYEIKVYNTLSDSEKMIEKAIKTVCGVDPMFSMTKEVKKYYDIFLLPPHLEEMDQLQARQFLRIRNTSGRYSLLFSEILKEDGLIMSPDMEYDIDSNTFGGLMSLGYKIEAILNRKSLIYKYKDVKVSIDMFKEMTGTNFLQIKGKDRNAVFDIASELKIDKASTIEKTYIEIFNEIKEKSQKKFPSLVIDTNLKNKTEVPFTPVTQTPLSPCSPLSD